MFAAPDTPQGRAIGQINTRWGTDPQSRSGRESIGIPVCKKKYKPFKVTVAGIFKEEEGEDDEETTTNDDNKYYLHVERMYGCRSHDEMRKEAIRRYGLREGWEPFGQWSLRKAQENALKETRQLRKSVTFEDVGFAAEGESSDESLLSSSTVSSGLLFCAPTGTMVPSPAALEALSSHKTVMEAARRVCLNGNCVWKMKTSFDDVEEEIKAVAMNDSAASASAAEME